MVKAKLISIATAFALSCAWLSAQNIRVEWTQSPVDGSRTGITAASADNVAEAMGTMKGRKYLAPNGKTFRKGSTAKVARLMIEAQPEMHYLKQVIGYSPEVMEKHAPESALSNWFIDALMTQCEALSGKKVDVGIVNFGGIRVDMPKGDVLYDDIASMFPFKNNVVYLEMYGRDIRAILENMARRNFHVLGGVRCVVKDRELVSAEIGGNPIDDDRVYGVCTISFLLNGGDGLSLGDNALNTTIFDEYVMDVMLPYVQGLTDRGLPITGKADGRVTVIGTDNERR